VSVGYFVSTTIYRVSGKKTERFELPKNITMLNLCHSKTLKNMSEYKVIQLVHNGC